MGWLERLFGIRARTESGTSAPPATAGPAAPAGVEDREFERAMAIRRAIGARLDEVYGGQAPFHYGVQVAFADGGPDPLDAVSIYFHPEGPHWHYVSFGLEPVMGAELTFRLAARPEDIGGDGKTFATALAKNAPTWPIQMLNMLARRVHRTGRPFANHHWWQGAPGVLEPHTALRALVFVNDPTLGTVTDGDTTVQMLQVAGITTATLEDIQREAAAGTERAVIDALIRTSPWMITNLAEFDAEPSAMA
jgi:hypothetical protein